MNISNREESYIFSKLDKYLEEFDNEIKTPNLNHDDCETEEKIVKDLNRSYQNAIINNIEHPEKLRNKQFFAITWAMILSSFWVLFIIFFVLLLGYEGIPNSLHSTFSLDSSVIIAILTTLTINILGILYVSIKWLFKFII